MRHDGNHPNGPGPLPGIDRREFIRLAGTALALLTTGAPRNVLAEPLDELAALDATAQADLVRKKEVTPKELVDAAIRRIEKLNPKLNAVVTSCFERALEQAKGKAPEGPFPGVPFLVKDLAAYEDVRLTYGSRFFANNVAEFTHEVIRRMDNSGLVVLGKTNTPEFGFLPITEPLLHGPTANPWNTDRSPGGSSGGSAAAVAAGIVPIAQASDGGGSIRIPASCCGIFGMKVSRGRIPEYPESTWHGLSVRHCVSRSVRDSAILLDATQGPVPGDRWWAPRPERPYADEVDREPDRLRVGFTTKDAVGRKADPDCVAAVESTAKLCEKLGHDVEETSLPFSGEEFGDAFLLVWSSIAGEIVGGVEKATGKKAPKDGFEPFTWKLVDYQAKHAPGDVGLAWRTLRKASYATAGFFEKYDVLLTPVLGKPPVKTGTISQEWSFEKAQEFLLEYVAYTPFANVTGQPAMSVPLFWNDDGLPIGSHFVGRYADEATLFRLAAQLEGARPWAKRRPGITAA